jgi:hypothetical protein
MYTPSMKAFRAWSHHDGKSAASRHGLAPRCWRQHHHPRWLWAHAMTSVPHTTSITKAWIGNRRLSQHIHILDIKTWARRLDHLPLSRVTPAILRGSEFRDYQACQWITQMHPWGCLQDPITEYRVLGFRLGGYKIYILNGFFPISSKDSNYRTRPYSSLC